MKLSENDISLEIQNFSKIIVDMNENLVKIKQLIDIENAHIPILFMIQILEKQSL